MRKTLYRFLVVTLSLLLVCSSAVAAPAPSSVSAANYYDMKPNSWYVSLGVKGYQQTADHTCGPAAVMSLLRWYGLLTDAEMNAATELRIAAEMGTRDMKSSQPGTTTQEIVHWLHKNGFRATSGEDGSLELLRSYLGKNIPVLVEWIDWGGHWVVATGYHAAYDSPEKRPDTIFFADPAAHWSNPNNPEGISSFNAWRFRDMWFDAQYLNPGRLTRNVYIVAVPRQRDGLPLPQNPQ
jgi:hypothetical protein